MIGNELVVRIDSDAVTRNVYVDEVPPSEIGKASIQRASTVEFNDDVGMWEVKFPGEGVSFRSKSRRVCLGWEVAEINRRLSL